MTPFLKSQLPNTKILANWMGWFQQAGGKHIAGVCESIDPRTVRAQIQMAKAFGIDGFVVDWYGPTDNPTNEATLELMTAAEADGAFELSIMLDSGIFKWFSTDPASRQQKLYDSIVYAIANFTNSPCYTRLNNFPLFWEFGLRENGIDLAALATRFPNLPLLCQNSIPTGAPQTGTYAWVNGFPDAGAAYLGGYLSRAQASGIKVPCLFWQFDDHDPKTPANSIWGGPARSISPRNGDMWTDCVQMIKAAGQFPMAQICTWNDYEERTAIEPIVKALTATKLF